MSLSTVVSAYFSVPSKFDDTAYMEWISNFLGVVACNLVLYTSPDLMETLRGLWSRGDCTLVLKPFDFPAYFAHGEGFWKAQLALDPNRDLHTPELYAVWALKLRFLQEAMDENPFGSAAFFWCDAGSFRTVTRARDMSVPFPNPERVAALDPTKLYLVQTQTFFVPGKTDRACVCAGIFGGYAPAIRRWITLVDDVKARLVREGRFAAIDEVLFTETCVVAPDAVQLVPMVGCDNYCLQVFLSRDMPLQAAPGPRGGLFRPPARQVGRIVKRS